MDALRDTIATMRPHELDFLDERTRGTRPVARRLLLTTTACASRSIAARIGFAWTARRDRPSSRT